jgi:hypothetical protein
MTTAKERRSGIDGAFPHFKVRPMLRNPNTPRQMLMAIVGKNDVRVAEGPCPHCGRTLQPHDFRWEENRVLVICAGCGRDVWRIEPRWN